jgi:hypothetical protein
MFLIMDIAIGYLDMLLLLAIQFNVGIEQNTQAYETLILPYTEHVVSLKIVNSVLIPINFSYKSQFWLHTPLISCFGYVEAYLHLR